MNTYRLLLAGLAALALSATACTAETTVDPAPPATTVPPGGGSTSTGFYQLIWTVDGTTDPAACAYIGADEMELTLYENGVPKQPVVAPCGNFNLQVELRPGVYDADARLVTFDGYPITQPLALDELVITSGTTLTSDADF